MFYVLIMCWLSLFALSWLIIIFEKFQNNTSDFFWVLFLTIAFILSVSLDDQGKKNDDNKVK